MSPSGKGVGRKKAARKAKSGRGGKARKAASRKAGTKKAPKKKAPKKKAPKKKAPKKKAPKKKAPKKKAPKKKAPKKKAPKKEAPKKEAPKKEAPKKEAPKKEAPKNKTPKKKAAGKKASGTKPGGAASRKTSEGTAPQRSSGAGTAPPKTKRGAGRSSAPSPEPVERVVEEVPSPVALRLAPRPQRPAGSPPLGPGAGGRALRPGGLPEPLWDAIELPDQRVQLKRYYHSAQMPSPMSGFLEPLRVRTEDDGSGIVILECSASSLRFALTIPQATRGEKSAIKKKQQAGDDPVCPRHDPMQRLNRVGQYLVCPLCGVRYGRV